MTAYLIGSCVFSLLVDLDRIGFHFGLLDILNLPDHREGVLLATEHLNQPGRSNIS